MQLDLKIGEFLKSLNGVSRVLRSPTPSMQARDYTSQETVDSLLTIEMFNESAFRREISSPCRTAP